MNFKSVNGNGAVKISTILDWVFRILSLTVLVGAPLLVNLEHRMTVLESTYFGSSQGNELYNKVVRLEERCRGYEKELAALERQIERLERRR